jgi:hypothetical protein
MEIKTGSQHSLNREEMETHKCSRAAHRGCRRFGAGAVAVPTLPYALCAMPLLLRSAI